MKEIEVELEQMRERLIRIAYEWNETPLSAVAQQAKDLSPIIDWAKHQRISMEIQQKKQERGLTGISATCRPCED